MAQGTYSEDQFLSQSTSPPDGSIWLWVDDVIGKVKWVKIAHIDHDGNRVSNLTQQLKQFELSLTRPVDVNSNVLERNMQSWVIESRRDFPNQGYTLFEISTGISSRAVDSSDGGSYSGDGFSFSASGNSIWYATGSGGELQPTLATGVTSSIPQGYFPKTTNFPRTQYFRSYGNSQWFSAYGTQTSNSGVISDDGLSFTNAPSEVNNSNSSVTTAEASPNVLPFYMDASDSILSLSDSEILDLNPTPVMDINVVQILFANTGNPTDSVATLCTNGDTDASTGNGMVLDVDSNSVITVDDDGKYRIETGTNAHPSTTNLRLEQVGVRNRVWDPDSIRTNGVGTTTTTAGRYMISTSTIGLSIQDRTRAVATLTNPGDGTIRLTRIDYCPVVITTPDATFVAGSAPFNFGGNGGGAINGIHSSTVTGTFGYGTWTSPATTHPTGNLGSIIGFTTMVGKNGLGVFNDSASGGNIAFVRTGNTAVPPSYTGRWTDSAGGSGTWSFNPNELTTSLPIVITDNNGNVILREFVGGNLTGNITDGATVSVFFD